MGYILNILPPETTPEKIACGGAGLLALLVLVGAGFGLFELVAWQVGSIQQEVRERIAQRQRGML